VVTEYLGWQIYMESDGSRQDIKYGDVLDSSIRTERRPGGKEGWRS